MSTSKTIGILYPGEMGAALARLFVAGGACVVTTLNDRGEATARRARDAGCITLESLADVVRQSDIVVSLVPPAAAEEMVETYCSMAHLAPANAIFVDANSINPELASVLAARVASVGHDFIDAAVNGLAKNLTTSATLFLSGSRSTELAHLIGNRMRVRDLGDEPGKASAMKMLLSGLSKGVCALFAETAITAHRRGMLKEMIDAYALIYPGMMELIHRMFPTYAQHSARRATEMRETEETAKASGIEPPTLSGVRELHQQLAAINYDAPGAPVQWDVTNLIEFLASEDFLVALATVSGEGFEGETKESKVV